MKTAMQIYATRFEQVARAGVLASDIVGASRRQVVDAAKAATLYINAGEETLGMEIICQLTTEATGHWRQAAMQRVHDQMVANQKFNGRSKP